MANTHFSSSVKDLVYLFFLPPSPSRPKRGNLPTALLGRHIAKECTKYRADAYIKAGEHVKRYILGK
jgi:hypothetical protein